MQIYIHFENPGILIPEFKTSSRNVEMFSYKPDFRKYIVFRWLFFKFDIEYKVSKL